MTPYQSYIHLSRYARWRPSDERRETWSETVDRYVDFFRHRAPSLDWPELREAILAQDVMPSMRAMMTAGKALERENLAGYGCCYLTISDWDVYPELLYILMCGTGVGFSVEASLVSRLTPIPTTFSHGPTVVFADSKGGWARGYRDYLHHLLNGWLPSYDLSAIRPEGAPLKTFGGRASGPEPLRRLLEYTKELFLNARGRIPTTLEAHDLACMIATCVVVGGVRRSALISLSDLSDESLRHAKSGTWYEHDLHRRLANNSAVYTARPLVGDFLKEWTALMESGSGERGIFNRAAASARLAKISRTPVPHLGTNPCGEIVLRPFELCNLTEVIIRPADTDADIRRKVRLATVLGTVQSSLTSFNFVRPDYAQNCTSERLLGVSLTGIMDNVLTISAPAPALTSWRRLARETNLEVSRALNISPSAAITCVKPSGTVSQLVDSASGIHPRWSPYYLRRVRATKTDPVSSLLLASGYPYEEDLTDPHTLVFTFPQAAPPCSVSRDQLSALDQLAVWQKYNTHWCDHNPSCTVYVRPDEWLRVASWVYDNFDSIGGLSFLPYSDHIYQQAPYEEVGKEVYEKALAAQPSFDPAHLRYYETSDRTTGTQEYACVAGTCEIV